MLEGTSINQKIQGAQEIGQEIMHDISNVCPADQLPTGWALPKGRKCTCFTSDQKQFLLEHFDRGVRTNKKVDPKWLADQMHKEKVQGNPKFSPNEWLTWQQIASFFSGMSKKRTKSAFDQHTRSQPTRHDKDRGEAACQLRSHKLKMQKNQWRLMLTKQKYQNQMS